jgi:hypothetical protein
MPRKTALDVDPSLRAAVEEFGALGFVKEEAARAVYEYQDEDTKAAIDAVVDVLTANATGVVTFSERRWSSSAEVSQGMLATHLFWLGVQVVSDLAAVGIQVANFQFDPSHCAVCGEELA